MSNKDTKDKILSVAGALFAENGYDSTSIRDISKEAGVNLASINYHFKNKLNLYREVMNASILNIQADVERLGTQSDNLKDFYWNLFKQFTDNHESFTNGFKLFMTNTLPVSEEIIPSACAEDFGPPGFKMMLELVTREVGEEAPQSGREWLVRTIFAYICHSSLMMSCSFVKIMEDKVPFLQEDEKRRSIDNLVESSLNFLKEHPEKFSTDV